MNLLRFLENFYAQQPASGLLLRPPGRAAKRLAAEVYARYAAGAVLEYELGCAEFAGLAFACTSATLVPREDSLALMAAVGEFLAAKRGAKVLEIGAGTGVLSVFLALASAGRVGAEFLPPGLAAKLASSAPQITSCDISAPAVKIARLNAAAKGVCVDFVHADFAELDFGEFDLVFSNPPYISRGYELDERVRQEPATALFGGEQGTEILARIIAKAGREGVRALACEIGYDQREFCEAALEQAGFAAPRWQRDLGGIDRAFLALKNN